MCTVKSVQSCNLVNYFLLLGMHKYLLSVILFICFMSTAQRDSSNTWRLLAAFQYHPYDFFLGARVARHVGPHQFHASLLLGLNRTVFQQRLYPKIGMYYGYDLWKHPTWAIVPEVHLHYSFIDLSTQEKQQGHFLESGLGLAFGYGRKNTWMIAAIIGPMWSHYSPKNTELTWNTVYEVRWIHPVRW